MFQDGSIEGVTFRPLDCHRDRRGWLVELFRTDELTAANQPQMAYVSETLPGESRGPHQHVDQSDYFAFVGPGDFKLYLWDTRTLSPTHAHRQIVVVGETNPQSVLIPPGVVHAYKNVSPYPALAFNCPNRLYAGPGRHEPVDEVRHEAADCPYVMD